jgi:hypothetical protein
MVAIGSVRGATDYPYAPMPLQDDIHEWVIALAALAAGATPATVAITRSTTTRTTPSSLGASLVRTGS